MPSFSEELQQETLVLLSLNRYPIERNAVLNLMKNPVVAKFFGKLHKAQYPDFLMPARLLHLMGSSIDYSVSDKTFCLKDPGECERLAFDAIQKEPGLAKAIAREINRMSMPEPIGLKRDIRNFIYADNWDALVPCFGEANVIYAEKKAFTNPGQIFDFMFYHLNNPWLEQMDSRILNVLCSNFIPYAMLNLSPIRGDVERIMRRAEELSPNSMAALADYFLLNGERERAEELLKGLQNELRVPREAWCQYQMGNYEESSKTYLSLLDGLKGEKATALLSSFPGVYAVFALLSTGKAEHRSKAFQFLKKATRLNLLGDAFKDVKNSLKRIFPTESRETEEEEIYQNDICDFGQYLSVVASFWTEGEQKETLAILLKKCQGEYPVLFKECSFIKSYYENRSPLHHVPVEGIVHCCHVRPVWERAMESILKIMTGQNAENSYRRLCWFCTYNPNTEDFPIAIRPVEQKMGKHGEWSKGRQFNLRGNAQTRQWPSFFTLQDQLICNIIVDELKLAQGVGKETSFVSRHAFETAVGHPLLFWENGAQHFECFREKPALFLQMDGENACISFLPAIKPGGIVAKRSAQADVLLYSFGEQQALMAAELGDGLRVPEKYLNSMTHFLRAMALEVNVFSEMPLLFTGIRSRNASAELHVRLEPMDTRMKVELFLMPFPNSKELLVPCQGPLESIVCEEGNPVRIVRDFAQEHKVVEEFIAHCIPLGDAAPLGDYSWELQSMESCYDFSIALQEMVDNVRVHWPDNKRFKTSRRLTKNDFALHCRPEGDWLFSLEGSVTLDDGQVIAMKEMLKAMKQHRGNYILLDNGQVLALAESFRKQLEDIAASVSIADDGVHFSKVMTPFMRSLLADNISEKELSVLDAKVDEIEEAMKLKPEVPKKLKAVLRPYQKEGFEWLCRLDAWGVGACLADDMGLGKTVQVIAFMLRYASEGPALVVAPTSVCNNWVSELQRFAPSLTVILFGGLHREELFEELGANTVMICSYGLLQSEDKAFRSIKWRVVVLDEAQAIKNHNTKRAQAVIDLKAKFRMATTGTPLENNLNELWSLFNFINPGLLDTHSSFQARFALPIENEKDKEMLERLSNIVKPFVLRRLKKDVLSELPSKTEIPMLISLSPEESHFYEALRLELLEEIHRIDAENGRLPMRVIAAITKLRLAVCNPKLVAPDSNIASSKMEAFFELLNELLQSHHKILVFSQFVKHLALIEKEIQKRCISYQYLDGDMSAKERTAAVEAFQNGEGDVFLISLRAGGMGINLTAADYVIHLDPWWNPAVEDQASDRVYRIGQDKPVTIYRLIAKNTIEDKIIELHKSKRKLAEDLLDGTDVFNQITKEELIRLLKN